MDLKDYVARGEITREPIVGNCELQTKEVTIKKEPVKMEKGPCERIDGEMCAAYIKPSAKWRNGDCPLATHLIMVEDEQKFINPLKASKRGNG